MPRSAFRSPRLLLLLLGALLAPLSISGGGEAMLLAQVPGEPAGAFAGGSGSSFWNAGMHGLLGTRFGYSSVRSDALGNVRTYSLPVIMPLEVTMLGDRLRLGGSFEYAMREYREGGRKQNVAGPRFGGLDLGMRWFGNRNWRLETDQSFYAGLSRGDRGELDGPEFAHLNSEAYRIDNDATLRYNFDRSRSDLRLGLGHRWRIADDEYNPGETVMANLSYGYGFGGYSSAAAGYPVTMLVGVGARYNYADERNGERVLGTEYGTVFVAPGLQISNRSLQLQAMVEVPIEHIKPEDESFEEEVRASLGMKYYLD